MNELEIGVYAPQMDFSFDDALARAAPCERPGIGSPRLDDPLRAPGLRPGPRWRHGPWPRFDLLGNACQVREMSLAPRPRP